MHSASLRNMEGKTQVQPQAVSLRTGLQKPKVGTELMQLITGLSVREAKKLLKGVNMDGISYREN